MKQLSRIAIAIVCSLVALGWAELSARAQTRSAIPPLAHATSPYWSEAFIAEREQALAAWTLSDNGYLVPRDFAGQFYNFKDGARRTVRQPDAAPALYLVGNSALWDAEVPDEYTMASQLQVLVGARYRVVNLGMTSANAVLELARLKTLSLQSDDMVVFYDGYNDAWSMAHSVSTSCEQAVALLKLVCSRMLPGADPAQVQAVASAYRRTIDRARVFVLSHGATFYHILQPVMWSKPLSAYEQQINDDPAHCLPGEGKIVMQVYAALDADVNLLHILDDYRAAGHEVYVSQSHVNEQADAIIARAIYDVLFPTI